MPSQTLRQLFQDHRGKVTDKWSGYIDEYDRLLLEYQDRPLNLLEIGVQNGGSLEIWAQYFPNARKIVGCDINARCGSLRFDDPRISVVVGDANTDPTQAAISALSPQFEIIIDDGSHQSSDVVLSFLRYFKHLADGGAYVVEDLHTSYWPEFGGGLFHSFSSMTFFKRLADMLNREHWENQWRPASMVAAFFARHGLEADTESLAHIHSIQFANSLCILRKAAPPNNQLGTRIIAGSDAAVDRTVLDLQGLTASSARLGRTPEVKGDTAAREPGEQTLEPMQVELDQLHEQLQGLAAQVVQAEQRARDAAAQLASKHAELVEKAAALQALTEQHARQADALTAVTAQFNQLTGTLQAIHESRSWKTAQALARVFRWFKPRPERNAN